MARGLWSGAISFGLINIPVQVMSAKDQERLHFHMLDKNDFSPIGYKQINKTTGKEVQRKNIVKGYEYSPNQFVVLTSADFDKANPKATQTLDIQDFVNLDDVDPLLFEKPYYLVPGKSGEKGYLLLRKTLEKTKKAAVTQFVMRKKEYLGAIMARGDYLILEVLRYAHEIKEIDEAKFLADINMSKVRISDRELKMAEDLVKGMTERWKPRQYKDTYQDDLLRRIESKIKGGDTETPPELEAPEPTNTNVVDLGDLLARSLKSRGGRTAAAVKASPVARKSTSAKKNKVEGETQNESRHAREKEIDIALTLSTGSLMALQDYWRKRDFKKTKEPSGRLKASAKKRASKAKELSFVIQKHDASHLHYDFRLEFDGVLKSWSVPKGPSLDPADKRLAVEVEDHPLDYATFEGVIPAGEYGGGDVIVWDRGTWISDDSIAAALKKGRLEFELKGEKLEGNWILVRTGRPSKKPQWLLIKRHDEFARSHDDYDVVAEHPESVKTGHLLPRDEAGDSAAGSKKKVQKFPGFMAPQLAKLVDDAPSGDGWIHEIKYDGYRLITTIDKRKVKLWTRSGLDWTNRFGSLAGDLKAVKVKNAVFDGEVVAIDGDGKTDFSTLQSVLKDALINRGENRLIYYIFDLLFLNGQDLRDEPLVERKRILKDLLSSVDCDTIRYSQEIEDDGPKVLSAACAIHMEGIISKQGDSVYESRRSGAWVKSKCGKGQEFVIGGYSAPQGSREGFGSLILGAYDENDMLRYVGRVGTGFDGDLLDDLSKKLKKLRTDETPFDANSPGERDITFVKPELVCQVRFGEWTKDRIIRHSVFEGLRQDKDASLVKIETAVHLKGKKKFSAKPPIKKSTGTGKFQLTHPDKILYADMGITKERMAEYYEAVQKWILPHAIRRPLSLVRCPEGAGKECFFQKKIGNARGVHLHSQQIKGRDKKMEEILTIEDADGLYELVQMGVLEIHAWGCHVPKINKADLIVFDLDPDEGLNWKAVKNAALEIKKLLERLNLKSFIKTTGGKGLHIHVPILPEHSFDQIKAFSLSVVQYLEKAHPERYTTQILKSKRKGRIFLDYLRNGYGATAVLPYSLRSKTSATVATPITWNELSRLKGADAFNINNIEARLRRVKDPWLGYFRVRQSLDLGSSRRKS